MPMKQESFASTGFELVTTRMRKRGFLGEMNLVVSWAELVALRRPLSLSRDVQDIAKLVF